MNFIEMAKKTSIDYSTGDLTAQIAYSNAIKGYSRILSCLSDKNILGEHSKLISLPDFTFTRNKNRWNAGFSNGYILHIDSMKPFVPVGFRPNNCGVVVSKINETFDCSDIEDFSEDYERKIKGIIELDSDDISRKNHFFGVYFNADDNSYYALLHCSFNFVKTGYTAFCADYKGISIDDCSYWNERIKKDVYEGEILQYLIDDDAVEYYETYKHMEVFSKDIRKKIILEIFPKSEIIFNDVHQGFLDDKTILLGAYASYAPFSCPIMIAATEKLPLVDVTKPIKFGDKSIYCAPHGCGYMLWGIDGTITSDENHISIISSNSNFKMKIINPFDWPYVYRLDAHKLWCDIHNMGVIRKQFEALANFRI